MFSQKWQLCQVCRKNVKGSLGLDPNLTHQKKTNMLETGEMFQDVKDLKGLLAKVFETGEIMKV